MKLKKMTKLIEKVIYYQSKSDKYKKLCKLEKSMKFYKKKEKYLSMLKTIGVEV